MRTGELIQRVQSLYSHGVQSDDSRLTNRHIYAKLKSARAYFLFKLHENDGIGDQFNMQTIPCVGLIPVSVSECDCAPIPGCEILRSEYPIPKPLTLSSGSYPITVTSLDGNTVYSYVPFSMRNVYRNGMKYAKLGRDYFVRNEYLYTTHVTGPRVVSVSGIFEDPSEVSLFHSACGSTCVDMLEEDFPIEMRLVDSVVDMAVRELVQLFMATQEDTQNDSREDPRGAASQAAPSQDRG